MRILDASDREMQMITVERKQKPEGPYCPWPRDAWDDTCIHPPGCSALVAELWHEHKVRIGLEKQS